jgi:hypothetical protein
MTHNASLSWCMPRCRYVGEVTRVDAKLLRSLVDSGYIPVVATVATDSKGQALNVNADTAAGEVRAGGQAGSSRVAWADVWVWGGGGAGGQ